ncbi:MAG: hypothetical protein MR711_05405 [Selenomonas sp.]|nr:hypothetical protein [Selenomonas sp.]MCI6085677.1 hypothetical protein [Selenomonas sp.]
MNDRLQTLEQGTLPCGFELGMGDLAAVNALPDASVQRACRFFRLDELMHDGTRPQREAFLNVLAALNEPGFNFVYLVRGDRQGTRIYLGVAAKPGSAEAQRLGDFATDVLQPSFQGMFRGSKLTRLYESDVYKEIVQPRQEMAYSSMVLGIPSLRDDQGRREDALDFQGIDRLASAMHGEAWQMIVICEPLSRGSIERMRQEIYEIYEHLAILAKNSVQGQRSTGESFSHNEGRSTSRSQSETHGTSTSSSSGESESVSYTEAKNSSRSRNRGESVSVSHTDGRTKSASETWGSSHSDSKTEGRSKGKSAGENHSHTSRSDNSSESHSSAHSDGTNKGGSKSAGTSDSETQGKTRSDGTTESTGSSTSSQKGRGTNRSTSEGTNASRATTESTSENYGSTTGGNTGKSLTATFELVHKKEAEELKYIDESLLPRLQSGESRGMFKTAVFLSAESPSILNRLQSNIRAIFQSGKGNFSPLTVEPLADGAHWMDDFQIHTIYSPDNARFSVFYGIPSQDGRLALASCLTLQEVGLMAGLPQYEVPGLTLTPYTPFGLNTQRPAETGFTLGHLVYGGQEQKENPVQLDRNVLNKHVFVTGITGSGKTMTCKQLLNASRMNFLVIEPAKTEYRELLLLPGLEDTLVFSVGDEQHLPLRFNPFELLPGENLTSHIDMVKAAFVSSFQFEASMPQIFEMAIYQAYERCGWDTGTGEFVGAGTPAYPTLTEFLGALEAVVRDQHFGAELEGNYRGSLISRIKNLTYGAKGRMLDCRRSVDFPALLHQHVVLEMEELKSPQDKALIMALIMGRLAEAVKLEYRKDKQFRHITLVEEAHRLLTKVQPGDGESQKYSVGVFTDMLAEIRKYGESLIIVDQIPNKLSEDVLKNTATKIVHQLLARDDKEVIGDTMMLEDAQKTFLSNLRTGQAIVFTENWSKAACVQIGTIQNAHASEELDAMRQENADAFIAKNLEAYCPELGPEATAAQWKQYREVKRRFPRFFQALRQLLANWADEPLRARAFSLLPPAEEATPELAALGARLFRQNASCHIQLSPEEQAEMEQIVLSLLQRRPEEEIEAEHRASLRLYKRYDLAFFKDKEAKTCLG